MVAKRFKYFVKVIASGVKKNVIGFMTVKGFSMVVLTASFPAMKQSTH
jgi:hypothetical protein